MSFRIKEGDTVVVLTGRYEDKKDSSGRPLPHKVIAVSPKEGKIIVENVNKVYKHIKPRRQGEEGGIISADGAIYISKVALYCPDCKKGVRFHVEMIDGKKVRVCSGKRDGKPCGHKFD
ncbi:MAG TPA: 50S ribosomal protein L24 [Clostridiales bacterium]|nr:50S ribosomal protein L24 [Clostridiales bacterium]